MTKTKTKKTTKKYNLSRSEVASRLEEIVDRLNDVDTTNSAPSDVAEELDSIGTDLNDLVYEVTDEAF